MDTISDIAAAFGTQQRMADAVGVSRGRVEQWCQRNSIPSKWLLRVVQAAEQHGIALTIEQLVAIVADHDAGQAA